MKKSKTSLSHSDTFEKLADFWDSHDLSDFWDETQEAFFDVSLCVSRVYFAIDRQLAEEIRKRSEKRGISSDTFLNLIVQKALASEHGN